MSKGFRQSQAFLHTWSGLLLGWILPQLAGDEARADPEALSQHLVLQTSG